MLDLYTWGTPNGLKPLILLEELGVPYTLHRVDLTRGEQRAPEYLAINPNGKIPAMVDDGVTVFESGAVLHHLAEKHGRFLPTDVAGRARAMAWLFFQVGGVGPMFGQLGHFRPLGDEQAYAKKRFADEVTRLYGVLDRRLAEAPWLAGEEYSIADIATFPWVRNPQYFGMTLEPFPHVARWVATIAARPAVQRVLAIHFGD